MIGFFVIFMIAAVCRFVSGVYVAQMSDVPQKRDPTSDFTFSALFLGASGGGLLAASLPPLQGSPILTFFTISSLCRLAMYFALFRSFQEVRPSKEVSFSELFFSVTGVRPLIGLSGE